VSALTVKLQERGQQAAFSTPLRPDCSHEAFLHWIRVAVTRSLMPYDPQPPGWALRMEPPCPRGTPLASHRSQFLMHTMMGARLACITAEAVAAAPEGYFDAWYPEPWSKES
jgi:hypothetical protein